MPSNFTAESSLIEVDPLFANGEFDWYFKKSNRRSGFEAGCRRLQRGVHSTTCRRGWGNLSPNIPDPFLGLSVLYFWYLILPITGVFSQRPVILHSSGSVGVAFLMACPEAAGRKFMSSVHGIFRSGNEDGLLDIYIYTDGRPQIL